MQRTGADAGLACRLLEEGSAIGYEPSENLCEAVVGVCERAGDAGALQRAWIYARARPKGSPTSSLALRVAWALKALGQQPAAGAALERHVAAGGQLSPLGRRLQQQLADGSQQGAQAQA
jgi:hypothetical protein